MEAATKSFVQDHAADSKLEERRQNSRYKTTYVPCCIFSTGHATVGLMRNFSEGGARIEVDLDLAVGDTIRYFWEADVTVTAQVVWRQGNIYGVKHTSNASPKDPQLLTRSVRVPGLAKADCWVNGERFTAHVENISLGGLRLHGLGALEAGSLITVVFCGKEFGSVTVRWSQGDKAGLSFAKHLSRETLAQILMDEKFGISGIEFDHDASTGDSK